MLAFNIPLSIMLLYYFGDVFDGLFDTFHLLRASKFVVFHKPIVQLELVGKGVRFCIGKGVCMSLSNDHSQIVSKN